MSWDTSHTADISSTGPSSSRQPLTNSNAQPLGYRGGGMAYLRQQEEERRLAKEARKPAYSITAPTNEAQPQAPKKIEVRRLGDGFPKVDILDDDTSDDVLPLSTAWPFGKAREALQGWVDGTAKDKMGIRSFEDAEEILSILNGVNKNNGWSLYQRQMVVKLSTEGQMPIRIKEIFRWASMTNPPKSTNRMAFQNCWLSLIGFLTCQAVLSGPADEILALYNIMDENLTRILEVINKNVQWCLLGKTFGDKSAGPIEVVTGLQVFWPIARLLQEYIFRFRESSKVIPAAAIIRLLKNFEMWAEGVPSGAFVDALSHRQADERDFVISKTRQKIDALSAAVTGLIDQTVPVEEDNAEDEVLVDQVEDVVAEDSEPRSEATAANTPPGSVTDSGTRVGDSQEDYGQGDRSNKTEPAPSVDADIQDNGGWGSTETYNPWPASAQGQPVDADSWGGQWTTPSSTVMSRQDSGWGSLNQNGCGGASHREGEDMPSHSISEWWNRKYVGPGSHRRLGPRHDNDFDNFHKISVPPTAAELRSDVRPFLPASFIDAKNPFDSDPSHRLLDAQFRLLREDGFRSLRQAVQGVMVYSI